MDQDVARPEHLEQIGWTIAVRQARLRDRDPGFVFQLGAGELDKRPPAAQVEQPGRHADLLLLQVELAAKELEDLVAHRLVDLEPNRVRAAPATAQDALDRPGEIPGLVLPDPER